MHEVAVGNNRGGVWIAGIGLGILGGLTAMGIYQALALTDHGKEVPTWLVAIIGALSSQFGSVISNAANRIFGSNGNGNGGLK